MADLDETLKRLLDAEQRARKLVDDAQGQQEQMLQQARDEARSAESQFDESMRTLRQSLDDKAEDEARRNIAEMERRYEERGRQLEALAAQYREDALTAALTIVTDPERI